MEILDQHNGKYLFCVINFAKLRKNMMYDP